MQSADGSCAENFQHFRVRNADVIGGKKAWAASSRGRVEKGEWLEESAVSCWVSVCLCLCVCLLQIVPTKLSTAKVASQKMSEMQQKCRFLEEECDNWPPPALSLILAISLTLLSCGWLTAAIHLSASAAFRFTELHWNTMLNLTIHCILLPNTSAASSLSFSSSSSSSSSSQWVQNCNSVGRSRYAALPCLPKPKPTSTLSHSPCAALCIFNAATLA